MSFLLWGQSDRDEIKDWDVENIGWGWRMASISSSAPRRCPWFFTFVFGWYTCDMFPCLVYLQSKNVLQVRWRLNPHFTVSDQLGATARHTHRTLGRPGEKSVTVWETKWGFMNAGCKKTWGGERRSRHPCLSGYKPEPARRSEVHRDSREREKEGRAPDSKTQKQMALLEDERGGVAAVVVVV